jgi:hypothetical protein
MGLGHAFEIDPELENGFLWELAHAQLARQVFPEASLKYMPPTKHMTGNIFRGHVQDALFNIASTLTRQHIHLLGMMTEAIHTPFIQDRFLSIENARYVFGTMRDLHARSSSSPAARSSARAAGAGRGRDDAGRGRAHRPAGRDRRGQLCRHRPPGPTAARAWTACWPRPTTTSTPSPALMLKAA